MSLVVKRDLGFPAAMSVADSKRLELHQVFGELIGGMIVHQALYKVKGDWGMVRPNGRRTRSGYAGCGSVAD